MNVPRDGHDLSSLKAFVTGGSTVPVELIRRIEREIGAPVVEGYGMTEVHCYSTMNPLHGERRPGSVGLRLPYTEIRIADVAPDGTIRGDCPMGEIGHVLMRGPQVTPGYLDPRHDRGAMLADGWLDSGDLGRLDAEGYVWLTGRSKDLIIRGGHNIDPVIIEEALNRHPAVETAAAVGLPDTYAGELPMVFVQLRPGAERHGGGTARILPPRDPGARRGAGAGRVDSGHAGDRRRQDLQAGAAARSGAARLRRGHRAAAGRGGEGGRDGPQRSHLWHAGGGVASLRRPAHRAKPSPSAAASFWAASRSAMPSSLLRARPRSKGRRTSPVTPCMIAEGYFPI